MAVRTARPSGKPVLGKGLMIMGTIIFMGEILYGLLEAARTWNFAGHAGWLAAAGMGLLHVVNGLAWNHLALLAGPLEMLVLCLPLAMVAAGARMLRSQARERN